MATSPYLIREAQRLKISTDANPPSCDVEREDARHEKRPRNRLIALAAATAWLGFTLVFVWGVIRAATGLG